MDRATGGILECIDTHTHFLEITPAEAAPVIERAELAGVSCMLVPAVDLDNCRTVLAIADAFPHVFAAVGIHPNDARASDDFAGLENLAKHPRVRAIGETGLDFYRQNTDPVLQQAHLVSHMRLAQRTGLPIVLHNRQADEELYTIAARYGTSVRGVLHCFGGSMSLAVRFLELGYYISFAGNLTYPGSDQLREAAKQIPLDRILVETDSPYLAPIPVRGKKNEPANVVHTLETLAKVRDLSADELAPALVANARRLFGF